MDLHFFAFVATLLAEMKKEFVDELFISVYLPRWKVIEPHPGRTGEGLGEHVAPDWERPSNDGSSLVKDA